MLKNKKIIIPLALVILGLGAAHTMAKPHKATKDKIQGTIYVMPKDFLLNLSDGHFVKLTVGLILSPGQSDGAPAGASAATTSESAGTLPEEAVIRDIVTNLITNENGSSLVSDQGRLRVKREILQAIKQKTDVKVEAVLLPDLTVQ
jgi:flagellar basal body-associated protein FliL